MYHPWVMGLNPKHIIFMSLLKNDISALADLGHREENLLVDIWMSDNLIVQKYSSKWFFLTWMDSSKKNNISFF